MVKKLMIVLLVGAVCLMGSIPVLTQKTYPTLADYEKLIGKKIEAFNEAPSLKTKVASGELPAVEKRLPEEPLVVEPLDEIGQYGGMLSTAATGPTWAGGDDWQLRAQFLFRLCPDLKTIVPNIAKGWDWSDDLKTLTIHLRRGMRWNDGAPFTADDIMFWYEDIILNDELTPVKPKVWSPGGKLVNAEKINDYTVRFRFVVPYPPIMNIIAVGQSEPLLPKHYLKKYHIKYNPRAGEIAKKENYDEWWMCFNFHNLWNFGQKQQDLDRPTVCAWMLKKIDSFGNKYFERNPYYWKVDTAGNQLPYADEQVRVLVENSEVLNLKSIAGEFTAAGQWLVFKNYPLFKEGEKKGNYRIMLWKGSSGSNIEYSFNYCHKDPVLRKIFNDIRFRQAMSLSINRDEINEIFFFGKAVPRQSTLPPDTRFYEDWMGEYYAEYNPEKANKLLDEMGLRWDKNHKYRLMSDGKVLAITIETVKGMQRDTVSGLVKEYWEKVGVKAALKLEQGTFHFQRRAANEIDVTCWGGVPSEFGTYQNIVGLAPSRGNSPTVNWRNWYNTEGKSGEEPPEEARRLYELLGKWQRTLPGTKEYMKLGKESLTIFVKNLWHIGIVGMSPWPVIIKSNVGNAPKKGTWGWEYRRFLPYSGDQWFLKK